MNNNSEIYDAIVLAAGASRRVGDCKLLYLIDGETVISRVLNAFRAICKNIYVVTGYYHKSIFAELQNQSNIHIIYNKLWETGMFSSVLTGLKKSRAPRTFIIPGDYALIEKEHIEAIATKAGEVVVPSYHGKRGHPILISESVKNEILKHDVNSVLREIISPYEKVEVPINSIAIVKDLDTIDDYQMIKKCREKKK